MKKIKKIQEEIVFSSSETSTTQYTTTQQHPSLQKLRFYIVGTMAAYKSCNTTETMFPDSIREDDEDSDIETGK